MSILNPPFKQGQVAYGSTANRPASPLQGQIYNDTDMSRQLTWDSTRAVWRQADGSVAASLPSSLNTYAAKVAATPNLVAFYKLGEASGTTLVDSVAGTNATITTGVTLAQTGLVSLDSGTSALFASAKVATGVSASNTKFPFDVNSPFTIEVVIQPNVTRSGGSTYYGICSKMGASSPFYGWELSLYWDGTSKTIAKFQMLNSAGTLSASTSSVDVSNGTPHHIIMTYDGSGVAASQGAAPGNIPSGCNFWVDGFSDQATGTGSIGSGTGASNISVPFAIGARFDGTTMLQPFAGYMQYLAIYSGVMSPADAAAHYRAFKRITRLPPANPAGRPLLIVDTDLDSDVDDAAGIALASVLHARGECQLIGVTTCNSDQYSAPCAKSLLAYNGLGDISIGAYQGVDLRNNPTVYCQPVTSRFNNGDTWSNYPTGVTALRTLLANAPGQVIIYAMGNGVNLQALCQSAADSISPLTGLQLIGMKVLRLVWCGGFFPSCNTVAGADFNFGGVAGVPAPFATSAQYVVANWPTDIVFVGDEEGATVLCGPASGSDPLTNPLQYAYNEFTASGGTLINGQRQAWGPLGVLYAVRGLSSNFKPAGLSGTVAVDSAGRNTWSNTRGRHSFVVKAATDVALGAEINALLAQYGELP